jgi:hypothetical protein
VAAAALDHSLGGELSAEDDAEDVDGDRAPGDIVGLVEEPSGRGDSRVVDQDVERPELAFDVVKERRERLAIGDVQPSVESYVEGRYRPP